MTTGRVKRIIQENRRAALGLIKDAALLEKIAVTACTVYRQGGKLIFFGNGGSAADAQHLATEMVCRYKKDRRSLPALALTTNTSMLTAVGNDFSFNDVFARQIESLVDRKDMVIGISTSGNSRNILKGIRKAASIGAVTVSFSSVKDKKLWKLVDLPLRVRSTDTARIQEVHILAGHILCGLIEDTLFR